MGKLLKKLINNILNILLSDKFYFSHKGYSFCCERYIKLEAYNCCVILFYVVIAFQFLEKDLLC